MNISLLKTHMYKSHFHALSILRCWLFGSFLDTSAIHMASDIRC